MIPSRPRRSPQVGYTRLNNGPGLPSEARQALALNGHARFGDEEWLGRTLTRDDAVDGLLVLVLRSFRTCPEGGTTNQPRATPWGGRRSMKRPSPERAAQLRAHRGGTTLFRSFRAGAIRCVPSPQGVALGYYVAAPSGRKAKQRNTKTCSSGIRYACSARSEIHRR
jgi:hypothetical protein